MVLVISSRENPMKRQLKLRTKLIISYTAAILLLAFMLMGMTHKFYDSVFEEYGHDSQNLALDTIAYSMYKNDGAIDTLTEKQLNWLSGLYGVDIIVYNNDNQVILNVKSDLQFQRHNRKPKLNDDNPTSIKMNTYPLSADGVKVGFVTMSYKGEHFLDDDGFKHTVAIGMGRITIVSIVVTMLLGLYMAYRVSKPLQSVTLTAHQLSDGDLLARSNIKSTTYEITDLCSAINHLGCSLHEQEFLRKRLTADISHELRTPLNILKNQIEAMIDGIFKPDNRRLEILLKEVERLTHMVSGLEKLTNLDQDDQLLILKDINLKSLIDEVLHQMESDIHKKNIQVNAQIEDPLIIGDYNRLKQVFINLITNAVKFTPDQGSIKVVVKKTNDTVHIHIKDSGIGIPTKDLPYVFERFYRAENSRNRKTGGAGLGLAIVKEIIEAHKGTIKIKNNEDDGITVSINLPV